MYGKAHKHPKLASQEIRPRATRFSNQVTVSVDVMVSSTPGLLHKWQVSHEETIQICHGVRGSLLDFSYVHLSHSQLRKRHAKQSFEDYASSHGSQALSRRQWNFTSKSWKDNCRERHQGVSYAGVNSHHQMDAFGPSRNRPDAH
jgi:hypothetical protein